MTNRNPYPRGSYEHDYYNHRAGEIESRKVGYEAAMLQLPEQEHMRKLMTERVVGEIDPSHGHLSIRAREDLRLREIRAAIAQENRGEMTAPEPEPAWVPVVVEHPEAGTMRLLCNGRGWVLRQWGAEYGVGSVRRREYRRATGQYYPRKAIVDAAAQRALADPNGPQQPVGSPVFVGNGTDDPNVR